jgi:polyhydroxybutyrate depolymerase
VASLRAPDSRDRSYRVYAPAAATRNTAVPLLVVLHGGGGSAARFEQISGFDRLAENAPFIVAYPDAAQPAAGGGRVPSWNAGACCGRAARSGIDDVGFVRALIAAVSGHYRIDPRRVYVAGFSNGGMLAYRVACQLAGVVAAIGVQSATLEYTPCRPTQPVSLLHIHGTADDHVPLTGGQGAASRAGVAFTPPRQAAATIAGADGCAKGPRVTADPTLAHASLRAWPHCPNGIGVQFATVSGGTHPWMSSSAARIWSFLADHPRPRT